jgi:hypothetical protein
MNRMGVKVVGVLVAGLLVGATACGGSSKKDDSSASGAVTATTASQSSSDTTNSDLSQLGDDLNALSGKAGDCLTASLAFAALALAPLGFMGGGSESDIAQLQTDAEKLKAEVPESIKGDFQTYADGIEAYANALKGVSFSDIANPETQQKIQDASKLLETPEMTQAQQNIEKYFNDTCPS